MTEPNVDILEAQLRILAKRPMPKDAISQDPQTLAYGQDNEDFLNRIDVDLDLKKLKGFGHFAFHLTAHAYGVLVARTLLKYLTLVNDPKNDAGEAIYSGDLASFLAFFSVATNSNFVLHAMEIYSPSQLLTLKKCAETIIELELQLFERETSFLDELEDFIAWIEFRDIHQ